MSKPSLVDYKALLAKKPKPTDRPEVTLEDVSQARKQVASDFEAQADLASQPEGLTAEQGKTWQKRQPKKKPQASASAQVNIRLPQETYDEVARISALHGQAPTYVVRKLIDQWMSKSQEKREEILTR